jgi:ketosteroid isomerase-like protein
MGAPSIEDWIKINDLFIRYATALDHGDVDAVVECFTEDAVLESPIMGTFRGHESIREFAARNARFQKDYGAQLRHVVSNLRIQVDGERARALCYLLDFLTRDDKTELLSPGEYDCRLLKIDGEWLIEYRLVIMDKAFEIKEV